MSTPIRPVRIIERGASKEDADFVVVLFHGFGADGYDLAPIADVMQDMGVPSTVRYLFPEAAPRLCNVEEMYGNTPSWYDYVAWFPTVKVQSTVDQAIQGVLELVDQIVQSGIPHERIVLGGFSQGGALTFDAALKSGLPFAGLLGMSCDFPMSYPDAQTRRYRMFLGHGTSDMMVPLPATADCVEKLQKAGHDITLRHYNGLDHAISRSELRDVAEFLIECYKQQVEQP